MSNTPAPDAVRLVPVEPTPAMLAAGQAAGDYGDALKKAYHAMLAAAPAPATARGGDAERLAAELVQGLAPDQGEAPGWAWGIAVRLQAALASQPQTTGGAVAYRWRRSSEATAPFPPSEVWEYGATPIEGGTPGYFEIEPLYALATHPAPSPGYQHTAIMEAIRADLLRQHPDAFSEDSDAEIVIPRKSPERTVYVKLDISAIAEAVSPLPATPSPGRPHFLPTEDGEWNGPSLEHDGGWQDISTAPSIQKGEEG